MLKEHKMAKRKSKKVDSFEEVAKLQEKLMEMYKDREEKGYKSEYLIKEIQELEAEVNRLEGLLLAEEYNRNEFVSQRNQALSKFADMEREETELLKRLEVVRRSKRLATLRSDMFMSIIADNEGEDYLNELETADMLKTGKIDYRMLDVELFCKELGIKNPKLTLSDFVLKMFSFFRSNMAFKHYTDEDLAILFRRNFIIEDKRLSFKEIKEKYYPNGKTSESYTKQYKIIKDKFRKHIKFHPDDLVF